VQPDGHGGGRITRAIDGADAARDEDRERVSIRQRIAMARNSCGNAAARRLRRQRSHSPQRTESSKGRLGLIRRRVLREAPMTAAARN
jgi:hypothetical protein